MNLSMIWCWFVGHGVSLTYFDHWESDPELGSYRVLHDRCTRCGGVTAIRSQLYPHETRR